MGHILVVEDDPGVVELLDNAIRDWGHTATFVRDGQAGYQEIVVRIEDFDVILCDLRLPKMSGKQMLDRVGRVIWGRTPVILMTGLPHLLDALQETRQTAFSVLAKPFKNMDHVRDMIQSALRQRRLLQTLTEREAQIRELTGRVEFLANQAMELLAEARRDPLTSLPTRIQLADDIRALGSMPDHLGPHAVLCLIDMDRFRRFNDEGGYSAGDVAIQWVAESLERGSRGRDQIYRWGGDEFVALICCDDLAAGVDIADRLRENVAVASRAAGHPYPITLSAGVVSIPTLGRESLRQILDEASRYLKDAKAAGGNKVVSPLGVAPLA